VITAINELFEKRDPSVRKDHLITEEKVANMRSRRQSKILDLRAIGQTTAQIRSNMKVREWSESEQSWFDSVINQEAESALKVEIPVAVQSQAPLNHLIH